MQSTGQAYNTCQQDQAWPDTLHTTTTTPVVQQNKSTHCKHDACIYTCAERGMASIPYYDQKMARRDPATGTPTHPWGQRIHMTMPSPPGRAGVATQTDRQRRCEDQSQGPALSSHHTPRGIQLPWTTPHRDTAESSHIDLVTKRDPQHRRWIRRSQRKTPPRK